MFWIKFAEREIDFFSLYCVYKGYTVYFAQNAGVNFKNYFAIYKNGVANSFRGVKQYEQITKLLHQKRFLFYKFLKELDKQNKILANYNKLKLLDKFSDKKLLSLFSKFIKDYQYYFAVFTLPKYFIYLKNEDLEEKELRLLDKVRRVAAYEEIQGIFLQIFFKVLAKRRGFEIRDLFYCTPEEILLI